MELIETTTTSMQMVTGMKIWMTCEAPYLRISSSLSSISSDSCLAGGRRDSCLPGGRRDACLNGTLIDLSVGGWKTDFSKRFSGIVVIFSYLTQLSFPLFLHYLPFLSDWSRLLQTLDLLNKCSARYH